VDDAQVSRISKLRTVRADLQKIEEADIPDAPMVRVNISGDIAYALRVVQDCVGRLFVDDQ